MPSSSATTDHRATAAAPREAVAVSRVAFYLESQGQPLFAWLHGSGNGFSFSHGVVLCPPIGCEQLHAHRSLRHLADTLAQNNIPVLRFDYHGTGDSIGIDEDPLRKATWIANIRDAVTWMRAQLGCQHVSVIGLRMGATLATLAAQEQEIENLILWAPVVKGRAYVREMKALSLTADAVLRLHEDRSDAIEAAGFVVSKQTAEELGQIDLGKTTPKCRRVLIVARGDVSQDTRLLDHLLTANIDAQQTAQPGYFEMMAIPHETEVPFEAIAAITDWLLAKLATEGKPQTVLDFSVAQATVARVFPPDPLTPDPLTPDPLTPDPLTPDPLTPDPLTPDPASSIRQQEVPNPLRETICYLSRKPFLFGILTEPEQLVSDDLPLLVFVNAGCSYRIGPGRLHVLLARRLAALGFRVLRVDLGGLGDSVAENPRTENDPYAATAFRDIELMLHHAQHALDTQRVVLLGLCSGAYVAFQSAAQLSNPLLVESVLINPLTFFWRDGMSLETAATNQLISWHFYWKAVRTPRKWIGLFAGRSRLGLRGAFNRLVRWPHFLSFRRCPPIAGDGCVSMVSGVGHPEHDDLPADLNRVVAAGRKLALFCSASDPGHFILMFHARRTAKRLQKTGGLDVFFVNDADHTFSSRKSRQALAQALSGYLHGRYDAR